MAERAASPAPARGAEPRTDLDVEALAQYLRAQRPDLPGEVAIEAAPGGMSNPTFFVAVGKRQLVLRKKPAMQLHAAAHRIDREYRVLSALAGSSVPVPEPVLYCEDEAILGTPFYLMERLAGDATAQYGLPAMTCEARSAAYRNLAATLAAIHRFDWAGSTLSDFGRPGNYYERQIGSWSGQWGQFDALDIAEIDRLQEWLLARIPADDGVATIAHGDYRMANVMLLPDGSISGVFDWELSTIGHPLADLGFVLQGWFLRPQDNGGLVGLNLAELGIPSAQQFVADYYAAAPDMPPLTAFHIAFAMYRAAVGVAGVAMRAKGGAVPDASAGAEAEGFARAYARAGLEAIQNWK